MAAITASDLTGLGMGAELAGLLISAFVQDEGDGVIDGDLTVNGDVTINANNDTQRAIVFDSDSDVVMNMKFGDAGVTANQELYIQATTPDGGDDSQIIIAGGGSSSGSRGGKIVVGGNEATNNGAVSITSGAQSTADILLQAFRYLNFKDGSAVTQFYFDMTDGSLRANASGARMVRKFQFISGAGTIQGDATVATEFNIDVNVAATNSGIKVPVCVAGDMIFIKNNSGNTMKVWPQVGGSVGAGTNNALSLTAGQIFIAQGNNADSFAGSVT